MPKFDLKDAAVVIKDGYVRTGAVNNGAGYTAATTMIVDGFTDALSVGDTFRIGSATVTYTISAHSETTGATTSITFTPAATASDNAVINVQNHQITIKVGDGNVSYNEKRTVEYQKDRGVLDTVRLGDEEPLEVSFDFLWDFITSESGASTPTIEEALKKTGAAALWETSSLDTCEPYAVDIEIQYTPLCSGVDKELFVLKDFRWESLNHDLRAGSISCTGKCNITEADVSRVDNF